MDDAVISYFGYSFFVYPVTNYLVSAARPWKRWKGALFAVVFLAAVSCVHILYENLNHGPNHYQRLGIPRGSSDSRIKQSYRQLSLKLHPDKNKAPSAAADFHKITQAYNVLIDQQKRSIYERLGDAGVKASAGQAIDHKYVVMQMLMYYGSSVIFLFLMLFSEPSGDALSLSIFWLLCCLLVESVLLLEEKPLPVWLFQYHTAHDLVSTLRRLFPAVMNGGRCIIGAFNVDKMGARVGILDSLNSTLQKVSLTAGIIAQEVIGEEAAEATQDEGIMDLMLKAKEKPSSSVSEGILKKAEMLADPVKLKRQQQQEGQHILVMLRNLALFVGARYLLKNSISTYAEHM